MKLKGLADVAFPGGPPSAGVVIAWLHKARGPVVDPGLVLMSQSASPACTSCVNPHLLQPIVRRHGARYSSVNRGRWRDAIRVHNSETALQLKFLNAEKVEKYAACLLRIGWAQTEIDDAGGTALPLDQLANVTVKGDENLSMLTCMREHLGIRSAGRKLDHRFDHVAGGAKQANAAEPARSRPRADALPGPKLDGVEGLLVHRFGREREDRPERFGRELGVALQHLRSGPP